MHASIGHNNDTVCQSCAQKGWLKEINSIVDPYLSWITQLVRALASKAKGPG